jgi:hypothetical protein
LSFVGDLPVVLDAGGVRTEHEPVQPVPIGVEDDAEAVGIVERRVPA